VQLLFFLLSTISLQIEVIEYGAIKNSALPVAEEDVLYEKEENKQQFDEKYNTQ